MQSYIVRKLDTAAMASIGFSPEKTNSCTIDSEKKRLTPRTEPSRFSVFKVSLCGNQLKRDHKHYLTLEQARSMPLGRQEESFGAFIWTYALTESCI